ncbi:testisin-like [Limulus polyphemus]|uniref:Testisin-like n=1 Tax=Limulus polyphemus TaxID=6850 RepID=A0ABM1BYN2_LIMPO|nr:testisin-like [Limulus polyphemus]
MSLSSQFWRILFSLYFVGLTKQCGVSKFADDPFTVRIVGGENAEKGEFPWQVWKFRFPLFSLPHPIYWHVRVGDHHLKRQEGSEKTYNVSHVFYNHWYRNYDNDIAMMRLKEPVELNDYVQPVCLPDKFDQFEGSECYATGWGKVDFDKKGSPILQKVKVEVFDNSICSKVYSEQFKIPILQWHLCAGTLAGGKGTCHGDSGGPLQCKKDGKWYLAGVTSFGSGCAKPGFPDVYTRLTHYFDWVNSNLKTFER